MEAAELAAAERSAEDEDEDEEGEVEEEEEEEGEEGTRRCELCDNEFPISQTATALRDHMGNAVNVYACKDTEGCKARIFAPRARPRGLPGAFRQLATDGR